MTAPEFSRPLAITPDMAGGDGGRSFTIEATSGEREALARRFGLISLDALAAEGKVEVFSRGRRARISGRLTADVVQSCVISLAPVPAHLAVPFVRQYDRDAADLPSPEMDIDMEAADPPDPLSDTGVDLGELVAEELGLALDPYPRAAGAGLPEEGEETGPGRESPFSVLGRIKER